MKMSEEHYKKAIEIWKQNNPDKKYLDIPTSAIIELEGIGPVNIGLKIRTLRQIYKSMQEGKHYHKYKDLTEEEIEYWNSQKMIWDYEKWSDEKCEKAIEIWKKNNPDKKYLDVPKNTIIELEGIGPVNIGGKVQNLRQIYKAMQKGKHYGTHIDLAEKEIEYWTNQGMIWDYEKWTEEKYRKAIEIWKENNTDKVYLDIPINATIELEGIGPVNIGGKIQNLRRIYKAMQKGKHHGASKDLTEEEIEYWTNQGMIWDYEKWTEEKYRKAIEIWKENNPDKVYLDIPKNTTIELEGIGPVNIGIKILNYRRIYKSNQEGRHYGASKDLSKEEIEYWTNQGMIWDLKEHKSSKKHSPSIKKESTLEKYTNLFNGDYEKAKRVTFCLENLREKRKSRKKEDYNIDNILKEFDVDLETLEKYLERTRTKDTKPKAASIKYKNGTLRSFCIKNGYNYDVIVRAIKLHEFCEHDSLEQLINRSIITYERKGQNQPATWVYEKYGVLIKHVLTNLNLDSNNILSNMTKYTISLEEAIRHDIFLKTREFSQNDWLEEIYNYLIEELDANKNEEKLIEDILTKYQNLIKEYHITSDEHIILINSFERYIKTIKEYQKIDVGLETNQERKLEKIKDYNLEDEDIEESFFIPLEFEQGVLLGKKSELYRRRQLLRQYIIDWNFYTEEEKSEIKITNNFTSEEINKIESTRREINNTIEKSKTL